MDKFDIEIPSIKKMISKSMYETLNKGQMHEIKVELSNDLSIKIIPAYKTSVSARGLWFRVAYCSNDYNLISHSDDKSLNDIITYDNVFKTNNLLDMDYNEFCDYYTKNIQPEVIIRIKDVMIISKFTKEEIQNYNPIVNYEE